MFVSDVVHRTRGTLWNLTDACSYFGCFSYTCDEEAPVCREYPSSVFLAAVLRLHGFGFVLAFIGGTAVLNWLGQSMRSFVAGAKIGEDRTQGEAVAFGKERLFFMMI